jgi:hypothetical protein
VPECAGHRVALPLGRVIYKTITSYRDLHHIGPQPSGTASVSVMSTGNATSRTRVATSATRPAVTATVAGRQDSAHISIRTSS